MLEIKDLCARVVDGDAILEGLTMTVKAGEVHAIMGPNGSGKSTLAKVIAGHPDYEVTSGSIGYEINRRTRDLLELEPHERAREGVFLAFQYPVEVPGVSNSVFLRAAFNEICRHHGIEELDPIDFAVLLKDKMAMLEMDESFVNRAVNVDFSGGEKKRNEILQMAVMSPRVAFLDETDSGLDVDSMKIVASGVNKLRSENNAIVLITHYQRLLNYIKPDFVHIIAGGKIVRSGGPELAHEVEERGYDWLVK
ncbi:MAG: Fe-S cluster assembly ATPase SufC [Verrucomicrobia bacterium]|nr:Fe-S cluster assembly ATPase SufC [Verrucomicrobiota bacterium]MDA1088246.1 Fe-S cluster assembly ATPase SufC [Verrucomicrobiota bacterium]